MLTASSLLKDDLVSRIEEGKSRNQELRETGLRSPLGVRSKPQFLKREVI
jgi:hypothetical protein